VEVVPALRLQPNISLRSRGWLEINAFWNFKTASNLRRRTVSSGYREDARPRHKNRAAESRCKRDFARTVPEEAPTTRLSTTP
jgi:hypothetical protein